MQLAIYKRDQGFKLGTTRRQQIQLAVLNSGSWFCRMSAKLSPTVSVPHDRVYVCW